MNRNHSAERIAIIGAGRLAQTLWRTFSSNVAFLVSRHTHQIPGFPPVGSLGDLRTRLATEGVTAIWIATADSAIPEVVETLLSSGADLTNLLVIHSSGATPAAVLDPLLERGALPVALHPNGAFTGREPIPSGLLWGVSSPLSDDLIERVRLLLAPLDPQLVPVPDRGRALYHAAASVAANGSVALFALAEELYRALGFDAETSRTVVAHYVREAAERCEREGAASALTGPIVRGDREVVDRQRRAVEEDVPEERENLERVFAMIESLARRIREDHQSGASSSSSAA